MLTAIAAILDVAGPGRPAGLVVSLARKRPGKAAGFMAVFPLQDEAPAPAGTQNRLIRGARRILTVGVLCRTAGTDLDNEELRAWAVSQLFRDTTLGGIAVGISEGETLWRGEIDSQSDYGEALMHFLVEYSRPKDGL